MADHAQLPTENGEKEITPDARPILPDQLPFSQRRSTWVLVFACSAITLALNFPYQYVRLHANYGNQHNSAVDFDRIEAELPVMAGFPYRYLIRYSASESGESSVFNFGFLPLLLNLAAALAISLFVLWWSHRRGKSGRSGLRTISIADLLMITMILAASLGWWHRISVPEKQEMDFVQQVQLAGGSTLLASWVPKILTPYLPEAMSLKYRRVRFVRIEHPSDEMVQEIVRRNEIEGIRIGGSEYDLKHLYAIATNCHLVDLRVAGRTIDDATMEVVASLPRLETLNLMRTDVTADQLSKLENSPDLQRVCLIHSDTDLAKLQDQPWSKTVRHLRIGHPQPGENAELRISGWPELNSLEIFELDSLANASKMQLHLENLPRLETLTLDLFQKFDLIIRDLPMLKSIQGSEFEWAARIPRGGKVPGRLWCGKVDIQDVPEMEELIFFAADLEYLRVTNAPKYQMLGVAAYYYTYNNVPYVSKLEPTAANALIEGIGKSEGPAVVDLDSVPLAGADLSPLAENKSIRHLKLSATGTKPKQWKSLVSMTGLTHLDLHQNEANKDSLAWLIESFPNLEHLGFSPSQDEQSFFSSRGMKLDIVDRPLLKSLDLGEMPMMFFDSVRIVGSPNVDVELKLRTVGSLELVDAAGVTGFSVQAPLPSNARLKGFRSLKFFAVGGPTVTDKVLASIDGCDSLATLTVAYPSASAEAMAKLPINAVLTSLNLPGTPIDDEIVLQWPALPMLNRLDLRDTKITGKALQHLCGDFRLREVNLDRTNVRPDQLGLLGRCAELSELSLINVGINADSLRLILENQSLKLLDLSGSTIDADLLELLMERGGSLEMLSLRDCKIEEAKLIELVARQQFQLELEGVEVSTELMTRLLTKQRIGDLEQWRMQRAFAAMSASGTGVQYFQPPMPGLIDVEMFAPMANSMSGAMAIPVTGDTGSEEAAPEEAAPEGAGLEVEARDEQTDTAEESD